LRHAFEKVWFIKFLVHNWDFKFSSLSACLVSRRNVTWLTLCSVYVNWFCRSRVLEFHPWPKQSSVIFYLPHDRTMILILFGLETFLWFEIQIDCYYRQW
jgi:hypothetical protein